MLNGIMTAISVLMILGGACIVAESFMSDSTFMRIHRRTAPVVERIFAALNALGMAVFDVARIDLASAGDKLRTSRFKRADSYDELCRKYAYTLPAFSDETKRIMQREGHLPTSQRITWSELPHYGPKAPGLLRVWPNGYPPSTVRFEGSDTLSGEHVEPMREVKISEAAKRKIRREFPLASDYALRIVREVVEVEEIEIMSKGSAEVTVEGLERRYYEPIEEPDISRILLDES